MFLGGERVKRKIIVFLIIILLLTMNTLYALDNKSYSIDKFYVKAILNEDGSMNIEENIIYDFSGSFNGVYRTLKTAGSDGIDNIKVIINNNGNYVEAKESLSGNDNTYEAIKESDGIKLKIYRKSKNEERQFIIMYRVLNVAVKYNDTAELYWKFMGKDTDVTIRHFKVDLKIPKGSNYDDIKVFAHGPLSGSIQKIDSENITMYVDNLAPNIFVEGRILFPTRLIEKSTKVVDRDALSRILKEEEMWVKEANAKRQRARMLVSISFIYAIVQIFLIVYIYFKYDKEYSTSFKGPYFRELPGNYSPAVMSILWNFGKINPRDITATLMDLVRRKHLILKAEVNNKKGIFKDKEDIDYIFVLNNEADKSDLSQHEKFFIEWTIGEIGDGQKVSIDNIKDYTKSRAKAVNFKRDYDAWVEYIKLEAEGYKFFDKSSIKGNIIGIVSSLLGIALGIYTATAHQNFIGLAVLIVTSLILMIYSFTVKRRSKYGVEQYKMWKAFRNFLKHFSSLDKAEIPSVTIWEHYLVYAISLGVAKEVIKQLKMVFRDEDFNNRSLTYMYYGFYGNRMNHLDAISHVTNTVTKATESTYSQAMSKLSSSSGGGGGFSGGGGGGGGGGGAGAF